MKYILIFCCMSILLVSCIKPDRDNAYDPNNPCKASVSGIVYGHDDRPVFNAHILLSQDGEIKREEQTDANGKYQITDIDPGIYYVEGKAPGYIPYTDTADLWAGREEDSADIYLQELFFDFEDVPVNTIEPYAFNIIIGSWAVVDVPGQDHAYAGYQDTMDDEAITYLELEFKDYYVDVMINLLSSSTGYPGVHLILKYQDPGNFYWVGIGHDYIKMYKRENWNPISLYEDHDITFQYDQWYQLAVEVSGDTYTVAVPGKTQFTVDNSGWSTGAIGLYLVNWQGLGTNAVYDNLYIDTRPQ